MHVTGHPIVGWLVPAAVISAVASPLHGQGPRLPPSLNRWTVPVQPGFASLTDSTGATKRTYWLEGGLIGAAGGLLLANFVNGLACEGSDCNGDRRVFVMLVGGFIMGALVGGGIEKKS